MLFCVMNYTQFSILVYEPELKLGRPNPKPNSKDRTRYLKIESEPKPFGPKSEPELFSPKSELKFRLGACLACGYLF